MGGWSGSGKDGIIWDGNFQAKKIKGNGAEITAVNADTTDGQHLGTANSPTFANLNLLDNAKINLGTGTDASISFDGNSLNIISNATTSTDTLEISAAVMSLNCPVGTIKPTASSGGGFDISSGGQSLVVGADLQSTTRTDATIKYGKIGGFHYTNSEEPMAMLLSVSTSTQNSCYWGGSSNAMNAATDHSFFTAADTTTLTGTIRMAINSSGNVGVGIPTLANIYAPLSVQSATTAGLTRAMRLAHGTPTTQNNGTYIEFACSTTDGYGCQIGGLRDGAGATNAFFIRTGGNAPTERFRIDNGGSITAAGTLQTGGYKSSDGSAGITATIVTAQLTALGSQGSMTFKNGILTAQTPAT